jgi:hypothetical protein
MMPSDDVFTSVDVIREFGLASNGITSILNLTKIHPAILELYGRMYTLLPSVYGSMIMAERCERQT